MITLFNIWHYLVIFMLLPVLVGGVFLAFKDENSKYRIEIIVSFFLVFLFLSGIGIYAVDKNTKVAKLYRLENKRNLNTEKIIFSGVVRNEGSYKIGEVVLEIKIENTTSNATNIDRGSYFVPSGFLYSFLGFGSKDDKPSRIEEKFTVAENLKPGETKDFIIYIDYPPHFQGFASSSAIYAH